MSSLRERINSFKSKFKNLFSTQKLREVYADWAVLMPAKSHLDAEYNFPTGPYAGQGYPRRKKGSYI